MSTTPLNSSQGRIEKGRAAPYDFSIKEVLAESWRRVKSAKAAMWGGYGLIVLLNIALYFLGDLLQFIFVGHEDAQKTFLSIWLIILPISLAPFAVGLLYLASRRAVNLPIKAKMIFEALPVYWKLIAERLLSILIYFAVTLAVGFIVGLLVGMMKAFFVTDEHVPWFVYAVDIVLYTGLAVLVLYVILAFSFSGLLIIEKKLGVIPAMKMSFFAFYQHWMKIIVVFVLMWLLFIISMLPLLIGLIWTFPMMLNMVGILYRTIFGVEVK